MNKVNNYENIFRWMKKATKTERHIEELELFKSGMSLAEHRLRIWHCKINN